MHCWKTIRVYYFLCAIILYRTVVVYLHTCFIFSDFYMQFFYIFQCTLLNNLKILVASLIRRGMFCGTFVHSTSTGWTHNLFHLFFFLLHINKCKYTFDHLWFWTVNYASLLILRKELKRVLLRMKPNLGMHKTGNASRDWYESVTCQVHVSRCPFLDLCIHIFGLVPTRTHFS